MRERGELLALANNMVLFLISDAYSRSYRVSSFLSRARASRLISIDEKSTNICSRLANSLKNCFAIFSKSFTWDGFVVCDSQQTEARCEILKNYSREYKKLCLIPSRWLYSKVFFFLRCWMCFLLFLAACLAWWRKFKVSRRETAPRSVDGAHTKRAKLKIHFSHNIPTTPRSLFWMVKSVVRVENLLNWTLSTRLCARPLTRSTPPLSLSFIRLMDDDTREQHENLLKVLYVNDLSMKTISRSHDDDWWRVCVFCEIIDGKSLSWTKVKKRNCVGERCLLLLNSSVENNSNLPMLRVRKCSAQHF